MRNLKTKQSDIWKGRNRVDKIREKFEKTGFFSIGIRWVKWNGRKYIKYCTCINGTADTWADRMNHELQIYETGCKSRDVEIKSRQELNESLVDVIETCENELKEKYEEIKELHESCNNYKQMYVDEMAEIKKKKGTLEKISQIDWSHTKESESVKLLNCITWAEKSLKDGE